MDFKELDAANRLGCCRLETTPTLSLAGAAKTTIFDVFVATKLVFFATKRSLEQKFVCRERYVHAFVATKSGQTFVATKSGQTFVATRPGQTFLATKIVVVAASANDASPVLLGERILRPFVVEVTSLVLRVTSIEGC